jgi:hypothetical protein
MNLCKSIFLLALTFSVQGCFFIYIPGSVISGVSDSITGSEGSHCVGPNAKVGDKIRLPGGGIGTVQSLSGTSVRCTNPEKPIRALLVFSGDKPTPYASKVGLNLPVGWEQKTLTDSMVVRHVVLYAINRTIDAGVLLSAAKREGIIELMEFANTKRANQASRLVDPQQSEISQLEIQGRKAFRFDVTGTLKTGQKLTYMLTIIEGSAELALLTIWASPANFERQKESLAVLANNVVGL